MWTMDTLGSGLGDAARTRARARSSGVTPASRSGARARNQASGPAVRGAAAGAVVEHPGQVRARLGERLALQQLGQEQVALLEQGQLVVVEAVAGRLGQQAAGLELDQGGGDDQELGGRLQVEGAHAVELGQVGVDDGATATPRRGRPPGGRSGGAAGRTDPRTSDLGADLVRHGPDITGGPLRPAHTIAPEMHGQGALGDQADRTRPSGQLPGRAAPLGRRAARGRLLLPGGRPPRPHRRARPRRAAGTHPGAGPHAGGGRPRPRRVPPCSSRATWPSTPS